MSHSDISPMARSSIVSHSWLGHYLVIIVLALALLATFLTVTRNNQEQMLESSSLNEVTILANQTDSALRRSYSTLNLIADKLVPSIPHSQQLEWTSERLNMMRGDFPELHFYLISDKNGEMIASSERGLKGYSIADRDYFKLLRSAPDRQIRYSETLKLKNSGKSFVAIYRAIINSQGEFQGVAVAALNLDYFEQIFSELDVGTRGMVSIRRSDDSRLVVRWPIVEQEINLAGPKIPPYLKIQEGTHKGVIRYVGKTDGVDRIFAFHKVEHGPFFVLVGRAVEEGFATWRQIALVATLLTAAILMYLGYVLYRIKQGEYALRELNVSLEERVARRTGELQKERAFLEQRVQERTADLARSKDSLNEAQRIAQVGSWELDLLSNRLVWSDEIFRIFEIDQTRFGATYEAFLAAIHPEDRATVKDAYSQSLQTRQPYDICHRLLLPDGRVKHVHEKGETRFDPEGKPIRSVGTVQDITQRHQAELALRDSEETFKKLFADSSDPILLVNGAGVFVECNHAALDLLKMTKEQLLSLPPAQISPEFQPNGRRSAVAAPEMLALGYSKGLHRFDWTCLNAEGSEFIVEVSLVPIVINGQTMLHVTWRDITERKAHLKQLEYIAHFDTLTGLPNRVLLADRLRQVMAQAQRHQKKLALAYLDLDGFKAINDRYGHQQGDHMLTALSGHMKQALREGDTLARLGGDEFVAVLLDLPDVESCVPLLNRLLSAAAEAVHENGEVLRVSASLGVTFYPQAEAIDADQLLRQADQAMYQAKLAGKNRYHIFDTEQDRRARGHHESLERLKQALDQGEFVLYYQPKVNMRTGIVIGVEALIRWRHPQRGMLAPGVFLPLIADHPLAVEVGEWVLDTAMKQVRDWKRADLTLPVSVNIDAIHLGQINFVERLRQQLAAHPSVAAGDIEIEVLETSALQDITHVSSVILACHEMGVGFALDDFGTGYSSLTYLKRLPAGLLKIDQSFVRDMLDDPDDLAILNGVLGLASAFRRKSIAEGVETLEHGEILLQLGCELAQGYAIARPMPAQDIPVWLATWRSPPSWLNQAPISRDDLPILFAKVEHRAWIMNVVGFVRGELDIAPTLHHEQCRVGQWLISDDHLGNDDRLALEAMAPLHLAIHELASELIRLKLDGKADEAVARLSELNPLRDRLLAQFLKMLRQGRSDHGLLEHSLPAS